MTEPSRAEALRFAVQNVALHAVLWLVWAAGMVAALRYLGYLGHTFGGFNLKVPAPTEALLAAARWLDPFWLPLVPVFGVWLAVDGGIGYLLRRRPGMRRASLIWSGLMLAVPALAILFSFLSLWLPLMRVQQSLPR
jgi:hypothetical protein